MATNEGAAASTLEDAAAAAPAPAAGRREFAESLPDLLGKLPERARKLVVEFLFGEQAKEAQESQAGAEVLDLEKLTLRAETAELQAEVARSKEELRTERDVNKQQRAEIAALKRRLQAVTPTSPSLSIVAFNTQGLKILDPEFKEDFEWLVGVLAEYDVVVLSEVFKKSKDERVGKLKEMLEETTEQKWQVDYSEGSGAKGAESRKRLQVHAVLLKSSLEVLRTTTTHTIGGRVMAYAPFSVLVRVPAFFSEDKNKVQDVCITSVHLPPSSKRKERDQQARALFGNYASEVARDALKVPFTRQGAREAKKQPVAHIVGGDENASSNHLKELGASDANGWHVGLGNEVNTSSGDQPYDNFMISKETTQDSFVTEYRVHEFPRQMANNKMGVKGVSDHKLIGLRITRTTDRAGGR